MTSYYLKPSLRNFDYVQEILVLENNGMANNFALPLFANGTPTLLFQTAKGHIGDDSNYLTLFGQTIFPEMLTVAGSFTLIAYFLKPHSLNRLFGISAGELTDRPIDLNLLPHCKNARIQEKLLNATSTTEMMGLLDDYLNSLASKAKTAAPSILLYATDTIADNPHPAILRKIQNDLCITERTFQRLFEANVGVSPGQFRRIAQFNNAFRQVNMQRDKSLIEITFNNGYADQSHFIRTFRQFTNLTPTEYLSQYS